ncbi:hypothetical protein NFI96_022972, partial [Prochilodus magdalenae]
MDDPSMNDSNVKVAVRVRPMNRRVVSPTRQGPPLFRPFTASPFCSVHHREGAEDQMCGGDGGEPDRPASCEQQPGKGGQQ